MYYTTNPSYWFSYNWRFIFQDIVEGNPKLNLAFVANLFNNFPALDLEELEEEFEPYEENREEKSKCSFSPQCNFLFCFVDLLFRFSHFEVKV